MVGEDLDKRSSQLRISSLTYWGGTEGIGLKEKTPEKGSRFLRSIRELEKKRKCCFLAWRGV